MKSKSILRAFAIVIALSLLLTQSALAYSVVTTWGTASEGTGLILNTPVALAKDTAGYLYVADMGNHRIVKMDMLGNVQMKIGSLGSTNGKFNMPFGVAIDNVGNILVADTANYRVQKLSSLGIYLSSFGTKGSGDGQFEFPREIVVDSQNRYHVTDEYNDRVEVFNSSGTYLFQYGGFGTGNGQFRLAQGMGIKKGTSGDPVDDRVYVTDTYNNRIQIFNGNGVYVGVLGTGTKGDGNYTFNHPRGVNIDANGNVYVADTFNHKIKKYDSSLTFVWSVGVGTIFEPLYPNQVKPLDNGYFFVSDTGNSQIIKYQDTGTSASVVAHFGTLRTATKVFSEPNSASVDASGNIYVSDSLNHRIQKLNSSGFVLAKWGKNSGAGGPSNYGSLNGEFWTPRQIWVDKANNKVYVADQTNCRIQVFSTSGTHLASFGSYGIGNGQFFFPFGVTVDSNGNIFVSDMMNRIQKFNSSYQFVSAWGSTGLGDGQFREPCQIAADSSGNIYVTDRQNNRVQKFDNNGTFLTKWGSNGGVPNTDPLLNWGTGDGDLFLPMGINVDNNGYVYVGDTSNNRMQKFTSSGTFVEKWGIFSGTNGNFFSPQGIGINTTNGYLYIVDGLLNRVVVFSP